jgi:hypothetical protein
MDKNQFPALEQFLGGYFHQDFLMDYGTPDRAIAAFRDGEPEELIRAACIELEQLIPMLERMDNPDDFLWKILGCYYSPKADRLTVRNWLEQVRKKLGCMEPKPVGGREPFL